MKKCNVCKIIKKESDFTPRKDRLGLYTPGCKICRAKKNKKYRKNNYKKVREIEKKYLKKNIINIRLKNKMRLRESRKNNQSYDRAYKLKYTYGISLEEFNKILKNQNKRCAICRTNKPKGRGFGVDHCHKTGKLRGILCHSCNASLGGFGDSAKLLERAIKYLKGASYQT